MRLQATADQPCQGCLATPRRPPEDQRLKLTALQQAMEDFAGTEQMILANEFI